MINEEEEVSKSKLLKQKIVKIANGCFPKGWTKKKGQFWNLEDLLLLKRKYIFALKVFST